MSKKIKAIKIMRKSIKLLTIALLAIAFVICVSGFLGTAITGDEGYMTIGLCCSVMIAIPSLAVGIDFIIE